MHCLSLRITKCTIVCCTCHAETNEVAIHLKDSSYRFVKADEVVMLCRLFALAMKHALYVVSSTSDKRIVRSVYPGSREITLVLAQSPETDPKRGYVIGLVNNGYVVIQCKDLVERSSISGKRKEREKKQGCHCPCSSWENACASNSCPCYPSKSTTKCHGKGRYCSRFRNSRAFKDFQKAKLNAVLACGGVSSTPSSSECLFSSDDVRAAHAAANAHVNDDDSDEDDDDESIDLTSEAARLTSSSSESASSSSSFSTTVKDTTDDDAAIAAALAMELPSWTRKFAKLAKLK